MDTMTRKQEGQLLESIGTAIGFANEGMDPSEAIAKVASQEKYAWDFTARMVEAFNTSKTCKWIQSTEGQEKAASFKIASPDKVRKLMFPDEVKTPAEKSAGVAPLLCQAPETEFFELATEKAARATAPTTAPVKSWQLHDMNMLFDQAQKEAASLDRRAEEARTQVAIARSDFDKSLRKLSSYFREMPHEPFEYVEKVASGSWGGVSTLMDIVWKMSGASKFGEKRASGESVRTIAPARRPFTLMRDVVEKRAKCQQAADLHRDIEKEAQSNRERLTALEVRCAVKAAGMPNFEDMVMNTVSGQKADKGGYESPDPVKATQGAATLFPDPQVSAETSALDAQLMLHRLMTQDPVISGQDPNRVLSAYNTLAQSSPRMVQSPLALQSALRKYLETGAFDTMDVSNLASTEKTMGDIQTQGSKQMQGDKLMTG